MSQYYPRNSYGKGRSFGPSNSRFEGNPFFERVSPPAPTANTTATSDYVCPPATEENSNVNEYMAPPAGFNNSSNSNNQSRGRGKGKGKGSGKGKGKGRQQLHEGDPMGYGAGRWVRRTEPQQADVERDANPNETPSEELRSNSPGPPCKSSADHAAKDTNVRPTKQGPSHQGGKWRARGQPQIPDGASNLCEEIIRQLQEGYECMICCEVVKHRQPIWSCSGCYKLFHLPCIRKWAKGVAFRCPGCQLSHDQSPTQYRCYCGKTRDPEPDPYAVPHSCGELCGHTRPPCPHPCSLTCHPGPCPPCARIRSITCYCGKTTENIPCAQGDEAFGCEEVCGRPLDCGVHCCEQLCHEGPCQPCEAEVLQKCHCGKEEALQPCAKVHRSERSKQSGTWSCQRVCSSPLDCGQHTCDSPCHPAPCRPCPRKPSSVHTCPCGKTPLYSLTPKPRNTCADPIPTCKKVCGKRCGSGHPCPQLCHDGPCAQCTAVSPCHCPCGGFSIKVPCGSMQVAGVTILDVDGKKHPWPLKCTRKCNAPLSCGRHRCEDICCPGRAAGAKDSRHICQRVCDKRLGCRQHNCEETCHKGPCAPCMHIITTDLACACGKTTLPPPLPCSTPPPSCPHPCPKERPCGHTIAAHPCHFGECPPCTALVEKVCAGGHVILSNVPCHLENRVCGATCGKPLSCRNHTCQQRCHAGPCQNIPGTDERTPCDRPCGALIPCGHRCGQKCHPTSQCNPAACRQMVPLKCECGRLQEQIPCRQYHQQLKERAGKKGVPLDQLPSLPCDADCAAEKRMRGLAEALGVRQDHKWQPETLWAPEFFDIARRKGIADVRALEQLFDDFLKGEKVNYLFGNKPKPERDFIREMAAYYGIDSSVLEKSVYLTKTKASAPPSLLLSAALTNPSYNPAELVRQRLQRSPGCALVFDRLSPNVRDPELREYLKGYMGKYALRWYSESTCVALFQTAEMREDALQALKKLKCPHSVTPFSIAAHPALYRAVTSGEV